MLVVLFILKSLKNVFGGKNYLSTRVNESNVIVSLSEKYCREFSYFLCNFVRILLSELEKGVLGEISVEARGARTREDPVF